MKRYQTVTEKKTSEDKQVGMKSFPNEAIFTPKEKKKKTSDDGSTEPV